MGLSGSGAASGAAAGAAIGGPWGAVIGGLIGAFAKKDPKAAQTAPFVPTPTINPQQEQLNAIKGNLAAFPSIEQLLSQSNRFQQGQASSLLEQAVPGYGALSSSITKNSLQKSEHPYDLPPEVQQNLQRIAAEKGINVGTSGQTRSFSALRDLGVNMLDYGNQNFQQALQGLQTVTGVAPRVSPMSPLSFMLTTGDQLGIAKDNASITSANNAGKQATLQGSYNANQAMENYNNNQTWGSLMQLLGMYSSGAFGKT